MAVVGPGLVVANGVYLGAVLGPGLAVARACLGWCWGLDWQLPGFSGLVLGPVLAVAGVSLGWCWGQDWRLLGSVWASCSCMHGCMLAAHST